MVLRRTDMELTDKCWCGHQVRWHKRWPSVQNANYKNVYSCKWCLKLQLKGRGYCDPEHEMVAEITEWTLEQSVDKLNSLLTPKIQKK